MRVIDLRYWQRESIVRGLFTMGMAVLFLGSMSSPWLIWPLEDKYVILSSVFFALSMFVGKMMEKDFYPRKDFILPLLLYILLCSYQALTQGKNINAYVVNLFYIFSFYSIFSVGLDEVKRFCDLLAKTMGGFLIVSMFFFLLYLLGFSLPSTNAAYANIYSYVNYYIFLIDDRVLFDIIPRFQSIFLEPGHLGTMSAMILFTQIGKWKRWYNISLLFATLISFSLAAYGILVPIIFLGLWIRGKQIVKKALYAVVILAIVTIGSFYYNNGDNLLHNLIMLRLEVNEEGKLAGDNRVTEDFMRDYESLLSSSDVLTGRDRNRETFGNSGFRVYIYDYGLIGLVLLIAFILVAMYTPIHRKAFISVLIIATLNFIIRGNLQQFFIFITLYQVAKNAFDLTTEPSNALEAEADDIQETETRSYE